MIIIIKKKWFQSLIRIFTFSLQAYEKEVRAREGKAISRNLDAMFKSLRKPEDDAMDEEDDAADDATPGPSTSRSRSRAPARKVVKAKRGGAAKKTPVAKPTSPVRAARGRKRSVTPAARPAKKVKKVADEPKAEAPKKAGPTLRARRATHPMKLRPRPRTLTAARKLVRTAKARSLRASVTEKKNREEVQQSEFSLGVLDWSPWKAAITPSTPRKSSSSESWIPRRNEHTGLRNVDIFEHDTLKPAVYEFAVQTPGGKKYPVLSRTTGGFNSCHWDTKLLNTTPVESQIDRVVKRGCKLFARRALFEKPVTVDRENVDTMDELRSLIHKTYDYPWQEHYDIPSRRYLHRTVMKDGVLISDNKRS